MIIMMGLYVQAIGNFTGTYNTDIYINDNLSKNALENSKGGVSHISASIEGRVNDGDTTVLRVYGYVNITHLNGTNYSALITPYFTDFFLKAPTSDVTYVPGSSDTQYGMLPGSEYSFIPTSEIITVSDYSISIIWDELTYNSPELTVNDSLGFTIFMGKLNTSQGGGGDFPFSGENVSHGAVFTHIQPHQTSLYITNLNSTIWNSELTSTTSTTTTSTTVTTSTLLSTIEVDLNVSLTLNDPDEEISNYVLYIWNCPGSGYDELTFWERQFSCTNIIDTTYFSQKYMILTNITGDVKYIVEAKRGTSEGFSDLDFFNPTEYSHEELVNIDLVIDYYTYFYKIGFSSAVTGELLADVDFEIFDGNILILSANSSATDFTDFNYSESSFGLDLTAVKSGFVPYEKGVYTVQAISGNAYEIVLEPTNRTFISISGYVLYNSGISPNTYVYGVCKDHLTKDMTDSNGFYNLTYIDTNTKCDIYTNEVDKINDEKIIQVIESDIPDTNLTLVNSAYNNSIDVLVRGKTSINTYITLDNCQLELTSICGTTEIQEKYTDSQGTYKFFVKEPSCDYSITANGDDGYTPEYDPQTQTKNSGEKTTLILDLILSDGNLQRTPFYCYDSDGDPIEDARIEIFDKITGESLNLGYTNSDGIAYFDVIAGCTVIQECDDGDGGVVKEPVQVPDGGGEDEEIPPVGVIIRDTEDTEMLDDLWNIVTDASELFQIILILFILLMLKKMIEAFMK